MSKFLFRLLVIGVFIFAYIADAHDPFRLDTCFILALLIAYIFEPLFIDDKE